MRSRFNKRAVCGVAAAASMLLAGAAQAALQDRDLDGDTVVDAFYDTDLDITWLRDANVNGSNDWDTAVAWADGYSLAGYSDWRLPTMGPCGVNGGCVGTPEMVHLWSILTPGTGNFQSLGDKYYWSGTAYGIDAAWYFYFPSVTNYTGYYIQSKESLLFAMAVHPGDIGAPVPEPESLALMLAGLTVLVLVVRRRPR